MALTTCNECGKQVSDHAKACPNCGAPIRDLSSLANPEANEEARTDGHPVYSAELVKYAEKGDTEAQLDLGRCYFHGNGIEPNSTETVRWWRKAAEQGHAEADVMLRELRALGF